MTDPNPRTRSELLDALHDAERAVAAFFGSLADDEFVLKVGDTWTPAQHLAHLNTAVSAVARGMGINRLVLRVRFGRSGRTSRSYEETRAAYVAKLAAGGRARDGFVPPDEQLVGPAIDARRRELLARWERVNKRMSDALGKWNEQQLDRIQLPHPLMGKITARELVFFTIYHNHHHIAAAMKRLPRFAGG